MTSSAAHQDLETPPQPTEDTPLMRSGSSGLKRSYTAVHGHHRAIIPKANTRIVTKKGVEMIHNGSKINYIDKQHDIEKIIAFDPESVLGWASMLRYQGTVFQMSSVIKIILANAILGMAAASFTAQFPSVMRGSFNTDMLDALIKFLMAFLAFMTGMFVNGAFKRWQEVLQQLFNVLQAVKKLYMDLSMHDVPPQAIADVRRWGLASVALAALEAPSHWTEPKWEEELNELCEQELVNEEEKQVLFEKIDGNKSTLVWVWIVMKLQECSIQGLLPPRTTPALVKIMDHCHEATVSINNMYELIIFQVPHQYMHMLAFLIHLFNIINTVRCGIELGSVCEMVRSEGGRPSAMQVQSIIAHMCIMMLSPLIYQAFLCISLDISIPFGNGTTDVPIRFLLDRFAQEIDDMDVCIKNPAPGSALPPSRPGTYTGSKFPPSK